MIEAPGDKLPGDRRLADAQAAEFLGILRVQVGGELIDRALTHRSYAYENGGLPTNERLEFLGDSVLGLIVTDALFRQFPELSEGHLAKLRAAVVNMRALAGVARGLRLGDFVKLGKGEEGTGGRDKASILADTLEAVIGAVYLDSGLAAADELVHRLFDPVIARSARLGAGLDWKTSLQELTAAEVLGVPEYQVEESGPDHAKTFRAWVRISGQVLGTGEGHSKKEAEQQAAEAAWTAISAASASADGSSAASSTAADGPAASGPPAAAAAGPAAGYAAGRAVPELPEVETVRRGLQRHVTGRTIAAAEILHPRAIRRYLPGQHDFAGQLRCRTVGDARRRGKYLWLAVGDDALLAHLGMSGQLVVGDPDRRLTPHVRARFTFADGGPDLRFTDQRTFGHLMFSPGGAQLPPVIAHLAADPLDPAFDDDQFAARLARRRTGIKRALLDQSLISGVGNIYADEALWRARLHWARPTERLRANDVSRILTAIREVFSTAIEAGGTSFDSLYVDVNGSSGYFDRSLAVYGRAGLPCPRCGSPVRRDKFMNRSAYSCPKCQRRPRQGRW